LAEDWYPIRAISNKTRLNDVERAKLIWKDEWFRYTSSYDIVSDELKELASGSIEYAKKVIDLYITQNHNTWKIQVGTTDYIKYP